MDKKEMDYLVCTEYLYARTKSIIKERNKEEIIFLHAGLTLKKYQVVGKSKTLTSVIPVFSELIEVPISKTPEYAKSLKVGTIGIDMNRKEFYRLLQEAQNDRKTLFTFKATE